MATIKRCDHCKKLSDDASAGPIGRSWLVKQYKISLGTIVMEQDCCRECVKKVIAENSLSEKTTEYGID